MATVRRWNRVRCAVSFRLPKNEGLTLQVHAQKVVPFGIRTDTKRALPSAVQLTESRLLQPFTDISRGASLFWGAGDSGEIGKRENLCPLKLPRVAISENCCSSCYKAWDMDRNPEQI
jgi:hypothetical protein